MAVPGVSGYLILRDSVYPPSHVWQFFSGSWTTVIECGHVWKWDTPYTRKMDIYIYIIYCKWGTLMIHPQVLRFSLNFPTKKHGLKSNLRWLPNQSFLIWTRHLRGWFLKGPRAARLSINLSGRLSSSNSLLSPGIFPEAHYKGPAHNLALC